jgi:hypothetical protein
MTKTLEPLSIALRPPPPPPCAFIALAGAPPPEPTARARISPGVTAKVVTTVAPCPPVELDLAPLPPPPPAPVTVTWAKVMPTGTVHWKIPVVRLVCSSESKPEQLGGGTAVAGVNDTIDADAPTTRIALAMIIFCGIFIGSFFSILPG